MHLGNSVICPAVGIPMLFAAGAAIYYSYKKGKTEFKKRKYSSFLPFNSVCFCTPNG